MLIQDLDSAFPRMLQILDDEGPTWWPMEMFESVSTRIPSNWIAQLRQDGSLHLAPESWLQPGFWEDFFDNQREGDAADTFRRELEVIRREA